MIQKTIVKKYKMIYTVLIIMVQHAQDAANHEHKLASLHGYNKICIAFWHGSLQQPDPYAYSLSLCVGHKVESA